MQRFRGGLVFKAHRLCVSLNSRLESNTEEEKNLALGGVDDLVNLFAGTQTVNAGNFWYSNRQYW